MIDYEFAAGWSVEKDRIHPPIPPTDQLSVSTQASHRNNLIWIYKIHPPLLMLLIERGIQSNQL